jgi:hypothetical protein
VIETTHKFTTKVIPAVEDKAAGYAYQLGMVEILEANDLQAAYAQLKDTCPEIAEWDKTNVPYFATENVEKNLADLRQFCAVYKRLSETGNTPSIAQDSH